jgi:hypothetical protein
MNLLSFALLFFLMFTGAVAHWAKKKLRGELHGSLLDYFVADYPGRSVSVFGVFLVTATSAASTDASAIVDPIMLWTELVTSYTIPSISWFALGSALATGWMFDSGINKGAVN